MMNRIIGFCSGLCLVSLFGFLLIMIVSFSYPNSSIARLFGNNERNISIGLLFINNSKSMPADLMIDETVCELNGRMLRTTLLAIKHINELVFLTRKENNFVSAQLPFIDGQVLNNMIKGNGINHIESHMDIAIDSGIKLFVIGCGNSKWNDLMLDIFHRKKCKSCFVISLCPNQYHGNKQYKEREDSIALFKVGLNDKERAISFLELFEQFNTLPKKSLEIVPVLNVDDKARSFLEIIQNLTTERNAKNNNTKISWSDPVNYAPSNYPKSDAFQIVSDIGARLALAEENAMVFLISSENLANIVDMSGLNRELKQRKWFIKDFFAIDDLMTRSRNEDSKIEKFFTSTELTSVSYLEKYQYDKFEHSLNSTTDLNDDNVPKLEINDCREMALQYLKGTDRGSLYIEILSFETICKVYKIIYKLAQTTYSSRDVFQKLKDIIEKSWYSSISSVTAVTLSYKPRKEEVRIIPGLGSWFIKGFVIMRGDNQPTYQHLYTHPMDKLELTRAINSFKEDKRIKQCSNVNISIWSHATLFTPETVFKFQNLDEFPQKALILPATGGVSLRIDCQKENDESEMYSSYYGCVPKQYDVGNLTCTSIRGKFLDDSNLSQARTKRSLGHTINTYFNFTHFNRLIKENSPSTIGIALKNTRKLLPNIMSCGASVAGCDYCMYFLTTYNLTVSPAACVGGCSLGTFASCSSLIGTSFVNTYLN